MAYSGGTQMPPKTTKCGAGPVGGCGAGIGRRVCSLYFWSRKDVYIYIYIVVINLRIEIICIVV